MISSFKKYQICSEYSKMTQTYSGTLTTRVRAYGGSGPFRKKQLTGAPTAIAKYAGSGPDSVLVVLSESQ